MNLDIRSTVIVLAIMAAIAAVILAFRAKTPFRAGGNCLFFL